MVYYTNMTLKTHFKFNKILAIFLSASIFFSFPVQTAFAASDSIVKKSIMEATSLLESAIMKSMSETEDRIKKEITEQKLDYHLTMESFHQCKNPYLDADYLSLICAYIVASDAQGKRNMDTLFFGLPFIKETVTTAYIWEYEPVTIDRFEEIKEGSGKYIKTGTVLIDSPQTVTTFTKKEDGFYIRDGTKKISPNRKKITYGKVTLSGLTPKDILSYFGADSPKNLLSAQEKKEKIEQLINPKGLRESVFLSTRHGDLLDEKTEKYITHVLADEDLELARKQLIDRAASLIGQVPYEWGGKASKPGYDTSWWTIDSTGRQKGLDCSGFVQWALRTAGFDESAWEKMGSTDSILKHTESITEKDLIPGDLGLLNNGDGINHVGIYLGDGMWIHCSSGKKTVVAEKTGMFRIFKRLPAADESENEKQDNTAKTSEHASVYQTDCSFTDSEIYLAAQLVYNEACGEGLNGWAAVAEVLLNRVRSESFPDTIEEVIYQNGQFSDSNLIETREPPEEMVTAVKDVLSGNMKVLNNSDILYFRNAGGNEESWGSHAFYVTINSHQFYKQ